VRQWLFSIAGLIEAQMRKDAAVQSPAFAFVAGILAWVYRIILLLREGLYRFGILKSVTLPGHTISVGNLVVGGTGKSPIVMSLCNFLQGEGFHPAVLSRGYESGLRRGETAVFLNGQCIESTSDAELFADEARMISFHCDGTPVIIAQDRAAGAMFWQKSSRCTAPVTHWILDDGFQHRRVARHTEIVVMSGSLPFGNFQLIPRGILREPVESLGRAHHVVVTNATASELDMLQQVMVAFDIPKLPVSSVRIKGYRLRQVSKHEFSGSIADRSIQAVVGIANPDRFINDLRALGLVIADPYIVPDHQRFNVRRLNELAKTCEIIVTTSKDFWRESKIFLDLPIPTFVLDIELAGCDWSALGLSKKSGK
jgi:tetraacyldisaccharide 4'-kinase